MAAPDCALCAAQGFRSCDTCYGPVMQHDVRGPHGEELCAYCLADLGIELPATTPAMDDLQHAAAAGALPPAMIDRLSSLGFRFD